MEKFCFTPTETSEWATEANKYNKIKLKFESLFTVYPSQPYLLDFLYK